MIRLLVPEIEARRHLIEGYAQFPDVPEDVTNLWKAPFGPPEEWDLCVAEQTIDGPHGPVPVRVYMPTGPAPDGGRACLVWMHGGAFAWCDLDMAEAHEVARGIAGRADVVVVSVDYRLCPVPAELGGTVDGRVDERGRPVRFPIPQDDCAAVLDAVRDDSARLGVDASRIAIGGASAEAALVAAVTLRTVADGHPPWQTLLVYPMLQLGQQPDRNTPPRVDDGEAAMLTDGSRALGGWACRRLSGGGRDSYVRRWVGSAGGVGAGTPCLDDPTRDVGRGQAEPLGGGFGHVTGGVRGVDEQLGDSPVGGDPIFGESDRIGDPLGGEQPVERVGHLDLSEGLDGADDLGHRPHGLQGAEHVGGILSLREAYCGDLAGPSRGDRVYPVGGSASGVVSVEGQEVAGCLA
ncbi:alpha/beta hydrolase fold domain-containing protein [Micromonospora sp. NPDC049374]|uniref:alpha/beta hydrolase n=1 Tax=Micromonospora sp. NPDC049374 TaxID=3154352 RepID=UPI0034389271